ncbi:short chain dehydrogenase [Actinomadura sp. WMMB 499]|uniref:short chain dehydrogenase n=1 Tax=Actinomadura sp. WMMB 499 TaxID=1219491 RepID=UPI0012440EAC|nr:short chain dehydrogenase [Actinomadura sp. WMMB 499]QFG23141.1 short chain dehydrogenase [Actinomadura sp. WMMB 499]
MKVIIIGATGVLGSAIGAVLEKEHEIVRASRRGPVVVDMDDPATIDALFEAVPDVDAVVCCAASAPLTPLDADVDASAVVQAKLLGQVQLVRRAIRSLRDGGSITLTSGTFTEPMAGASLGALVNAGIDAFVRTAAVEMPRGLRVNAVSPGWVTETLDALGMDGADGTPAADVARAYAEAVGGSAQGHIFRPGH